MRTKKVKQVYICEHCNRLFILKWRAEKHEIKCSKNPANKIECFNCSEFENINGKWICKGNELSRNPKYDNQKQVCTPLNKCEGYNGL